MRLSWIENAITEIGRVKCFDELKILVRHKYPFFKSRFSGNPQIDSAVPLSLQIEPTNLCNLRCICCSTRKSTREKGTMNYDLFQKILDDASEAGVKRIHLYLHGEPMLYPRIIDMIRDIKAKKIGITLTTNGMFLDKNKIELLLDAGMNILDHITFSVLGFSKEVHEKIMVGVNHEKVKENILTFAQLRGTHKMSGPILQIAFYQMPENEMEKKDLNKYWHGIVDHVRIEDNISKQFSSFGDPEVHIPIRKKTCKNLWERMTVYWNGDVTACIADIDGKFIFGNLGEKSIKEIWNCEELQFVKGMHREQNFKALDLCTNCDW